jgi:alpha-beta hydrolase superfamily lysophospholipase
MPFHSASFTFLSYPTQGLSDRELGHVSAAGHVIAFSDFTNDCAAVASHVRDAFQLVKSSTSGRNRGSSGGHLHVVGHSMGER